MSPMLEDKFNVNRVAVIGAGPCGLAAAKYLAAEKTFSKIEVFDQRAEVGGVWNYTSLNVVDGDFTVPRTRPAARPDTAVWTDEKPEGPAQFVSPVYDFLETNIPHTLMNYGDATFPEGSSVFPRHQVVKQYLDAYAGDVTPLLSLQTQVLDVRKVESPGGKLWEVEVLDLRDKSRRTVEFDAVMVASGHYNDPFIPDIPGLKEFHELHPGAVSHSKFYRRPDQYANKKVIIVGNSASGIDLSAQISTVAQLPVIISEKEKGLQKPAPIEAVSDSEWALHVPEITHIDPSARTITFANGTTATDVDAIVFCTGYFYAFPFLSSLQPPVEAPDGSRARHLWEHLLYTPDPTLAFLGIPQRIVPFPVAEVQSAFVARLWADRYAGPSHQAVPSRAEMDVWEARLVAEKGDGKMAHNLAFPQDMEYINRLHDLAMAAEKRPGLLENEGVGGIPPRWGADKAWMRERFPLIKQAARALGERRHEVKTLEELGFDFAAWKMEQKQVQGGVVQEVVAQEVA